MLTLQAFVFCYDWSTTQVSYFVFRTNRTVGREFTHARSAGCIPCRRCHNANCTTVHDTRTVCRFLVPTHLPVNTPTLQKSQPPSRTDLGLADDNDESNEGPGVASRQPHLHIHKRTPSRRWRRRRDAAPPSPDYVSTCNIESLGWLCQQF
jgi:hypothetical protein